MATRKKKTTAKVAKGSKVPAKTDTTTTVDAPIVVGIDDDGTAIIEASTLRLVGDAGAVASERWARARHDSTRGEALRRAGGESIVRAGLVFAAAYGPDPTLPRLADADGNEIRGKAAAWAAMNGRDAKPGDGAAASRAINAARAAAVVGEAEALRIGSVEALDSIIKAHDEHAAAGAKSGLSDKAAIKAAKTATKSAATKARRAGATGTKAAKSIAADIAPERAAQVKGRAESKATAAKAGRAVVKGDPDAMADATVEALDDGGVLHRGKAGTYAVAIGARTDAAWLAALGAVFTQTAADMADDA